MPLQKQKMKKKNMNIEGRFKKVFEGSDRGKSSQRRFNIFVIGVLI